MVKREISSVSTAKKIPASSQPIWTSCCTSKNIETYAADAGIKSVLSGTINERSNFQHLVQVSEKVFAVFCQPTASNPIGYAHVNKDGEFYSCTSKDCRAVKVKTKQLKSKNICIHIHMLLCCLQNQDEIDKVYVDTEETNLVQEDSVSRQNTRLLYKNLKLPYNIDEDSLAKNKELDSVTLFGLRQNGWPEVFEPSQNNCELCQSILGPSRCHPGSKGNGILITCLNPFRKITIKVKICQEKSCQAIHRVCPVEVGKHMLC